MKKNILGLLLGIAMVCLYSNPVYAQDENVMSDFYGGLASIIEQNMNSPDRCVTEAESFFRSSIPRLKAVITKARQMAQNAPATQMSQAELEQKMQDINTNPMVNKMMDNVNRFSQALQAFSMKYPDQAEKIANLFEEFAEIFQDYR